MPAQIVPRWRATLAAALVGIGFALGGCNGGNATTAVTSPAPPAPVNPIPPPAGRLTPPYRGKIIFVSKRGVNEVNGLYAMNPDGSNVTPITLPGLTSLNLLYPSHHAMSADGTTFVFTFDQGTGAGTANVIVNTDGTNQRDITRQVDLQSGGANNAVGRISDISLSSNGTRLLFATPGFSSTGQNLTVSIVAQNADGSGRTALYSTPTGSFSTQITSLSSPIFAPDDQSIYFVQTVQGYALGANNTITHSIYRMTPGAAAPTLVYSLPPVGVVFLPAINPPSLSIDPTGTRLVFARISITNANAPANIFAVNTDGTGLAQLTNTPGKDNQLPSYTTDGTKIIFQSDRDGNDEIYSMNPDGSGVTRLTNEIEPDTDPATRAAKTAGRKLL